jgi:hypothetical protein
VYNQIKTVNINNLLIQKFVKKLFLRNRKGLDFVTIQHHQMEDYLALGNPWRNKRATRWNVQVRYSKDKNKYFFNTVQAAYWDHFGRETNLFQ